MKEQTGGKSLSLGAPFSKMGSAAAGVLQKPATNEIKNSGKFKKLETSLTQTKCAFDNTPVGAFVNENKTQLIIVGAVAAIAGGVAMYYTKSGDVPAKALKLLPELSLLTLGAVDLSVKNLAFKPSEQKVGADVKASGKWTNVKANFQLGATFASTSLLRVAGSGSLILTFDPDWRGTASGGFSWSRENAETRPILTGSAAVGVRRKLTNNANLTLQLYGNYVDNEKGISQQAGLRTNLTVNDAVGKDTRPTLSPSYSAKMTQSRHDRGYAAPRTDNRFLST